MTNAGLKTRMFFRVGTWGLAVLAAATVTACGGGGGGGSSNNSGILPTNPTPTPSAAPIATPTPTPAPVATIVPVPAAGTAAPIPPVGGYSGTVAFAAPTMGASANLTITAASGPLGGAPTLSSAVRRPMALSGAPGLLYVSLVSDGTLTFTGYPSFTFTLPATLVVTANQQFYLGLYSSDQPTLGYTGPVAASGVSNANGKNTITFTSAFNSGFTIAKGMTYEFVVFTISTTLATPTPSAAPTATPLPTATPTATSPPGPTTYAPTIGYLAANPSVSKSFLGKLSSAANSTIIGIGTTFQDTMYSSSLGTASIGDSVSAVGALDLRRATQSAPANPFWLNSAWSQHPQTVDSFIEDPTAMRRMRSVLQRVSGRGIQSIRYTKGLPTTQNATYGIWVQNGSINGGAGTYTKVPSTLQYVSAHGYIWIDNTITNLSTSQITQIGADFDNSYASDVAHYGTSSYTAMAAGNQQQYSTCDSSGATLIGGPTSTSFIVPSDNMIHVVVINPTNLGSGVGGYFSSLNHTPQAIANCFTGIPQSNESAMFFVGYKPGANTTYALGEDLVRGTAHEFQHLINFVHHTVLQADPSDGKSPGPGEESWVNEGMSMLSQDFSLVKLYPTITNDVQDALYHAQEYLMAPHNFSITAFTGNDVAMTSISKVQYNCSGCYGSEYVFQRYIYDRFGGDTYLNASLNHTMVGQAGVEAATKATLPTILGDFGIALAASNLNVTMDPRWNFTHFNPSGTYTDQFNAPVTLSGPMALVSLSPTTNGPLSSQPYLGTVFFLNAAAAANTNVSLTDTGGTFGLSVGVVQR